MVFICQDSDNISSMVLSSCKGNPERAVSLSKNSLNSDSKSTPTPTQGSSSPLLSPPSNDTTPC